MTATTPPITAWYVLEVEGTGLASAPRQRGREERGGDAAAPAQRPHGPILTRTRAKEGGWEGKEAAGK